MGNTAYLNITVRVASAQALAAMKQINAATKGLGATGGAASGGLRSMNLQMKASNLEKFGKNLQWTGRQLQYNFTLPLVIAGYAVGKWALENEKAMTRVRMVYGSAEDSQATLNAETKALSKSFELLSSRFGVHQSEVIDIAQAWAEAGVAGVGLAKATQLTIETMKISGLTQEQAVTGLMAIQTAYRLNTTQLRDAVAVLAGVNKTGTITFGGLIQVVQKAGSAARAAGIDIRELAAMANVLTPAAGSASQAGNAMRTMISRLVAPTKDSQEIMKLMGIDIAGAAWQSAKGLPKFQMLAAAFDKLSTAQKNQVSSIIASRWQINRFDILMEQLNDHTSALYRAMNETKDPVKNLGIYMNMLRTQLESTPGGIAILTNTMRNSLTTAFLPMIPALVGVLSHLTRLFVWFGKLDPRIQQLAIGFLLMLALVGPIVKYMGAFATLASIATRVVGLLTIAISREAAASAIASAANAENAASVHGIGIAVAWTRVLLGQFVALLWGMATFPFTVVATGMGLIWRATIAGSVLAIKGLLLFVQWLMKLPIIQRAVAAVSTAISEAMAAAWAAVAGVAAAAWAAVGGSLIGLWDTLLFAADAVVTGIEFAWIVGINAISAAWVAFASFMGELWVLLQTGWVTLLNGIEVAWRTLPAIMGIIGQAVAAVWTAVVEAIELAWINLGNVVPLVWSSIQITMVAVAQAAVFLWAKALAAIEYFWVAALNAIEVAWRTLPTIIGIIGQAVGIVWQKVVVVMHGLWLAVLEGMELAWAAFTEFIGAAMALLPGLLVAVGEALEGIWLATATTMEIIWAAMTTGVVELIEVLPFVLAGVADAIIGVLLSPWGIVIAAVSAFVIIFRKQIKQGVDYVIKMFENLPLGIGGILTTVINMLKSWASAVAHWLSYLNPFARHSPSLVDQVIAGIDIIAAQYARLSNIGMVFRKAINDMDAFKSAISGVVQAAQDAERSQLLADAGSAAPQLRQLWQDEDALKVVLEQVAIQYFEQARVVAALKTQLDALDATLATEKQRLNDLEAAAASARDALDSAKATLQDLESYQLTGMRAAEDAIFANEMAQKQLQLQIMQMEDAAGGSLDQLQSKMAALRGEMEMLTGQREDLRQAGAGSDILATYDAQIQALEDQQTATQNLVQPILDAQTALEKLQRTGQELDLQKSINFDPELRQIDQMVNGLKEMPFDELYAKITAQKGIVDQLQGSYDAINQQVETQKDKVDALQQQRDALAATYDAEQAKLDAIGQAYDDITAQIQAMEDAVNSLTTATSKLKDASGSPNADLFNAGAGQNFDIPGGTSTLGREGGLPDIKKFNADMQKQLDDTLKGLGKIDLFKPFKDMWNAGWKWMAKNVVPVVRPVFDHLWHDVLEPNMKKITGGEGVGGLASKFKSSISQGDWAGAFKPLQDVWTNIGSMLEDTPLNTAFDNISTSAKNFFNTLKLVFDVLNDTVGKDLGDIAGWVIDAGKTLGKELAKWGDLFDPFVEATGHIWAVTTFFLGAMQDIFKVVVGAILALWTFLWPIFINVLRPIFDAIVGLVRAALEILRGIIQFILALINGDWGQAWDGIKTILAGVWDAIFTTVKFAFGLVFGLIKGTLEGIVNLFAFLWDHALGPIMGGIANKMGSVWNSIGNAIKHGINFGIRAINFLIDGLNAVAKILPGINFSISKIPTFDTNPDSNWGTSQNNSAGTALISFAKGGMLPAEVGAGFVTNGPRAIVGEGNRLYPEYVIPTDPRHRGHAIGLLRAATASLTGNAMGLATAASDHHDEMGGIGLHTITDPLGDLLGAFRKGAAIAAFAGPLAAANVVIDQIPWDFLRQMATTFKNKIYNWVKGEDDKASGNAAAATSSLSGTGWKAVDTWLNANSTVPHRITSTYRAGDPGYHGQNRAVDYAGPYATWDSPALLSINKALLPIAPKLAELIYAGPGGQSFKDGVPHVFSATVQEDHHDHVHAALAAGGRVLFARRTGGTLLRLGEGRNNEEVQVKPLNHKATDGETHNHFYGDLSFPNVKDGDDAEAFIRNLESLV